MSSEESERQKEALLTIVESQALVNGRYSDIVRIGNNGGNGCFSLLFKAKDNVSGENVALKFFDPRMNVHAERVLRFEREAQMLLVLRDEKYVIHAIDGLCSFDVPCKTDIGIEFFQSFRYIPIELASGSLDDFILSSPPPIHLLGCFKELVKAVAAIHGRNICHRDLKPGNFLFVNGELKLSDFGTAKEMDSGGSSIAQAYTVQVGDRRYTAPEVIFCALGIADDYVYITDMFSLGAILFEMFTGVIFTQQVYTQRFLRDLVLIGQRLDGVSLPHKKMALYADCAEELGKTYSLPEIFLFNDNVPKCIKNQLNTLYKGLVCYNPLRRMANLNSIYRQIDICILTLRNQKAYDERLRYKKEFRKRRQEIEATIAKREI